MVTFLIILFILIAILLVMVVRTLKFTREGKEAAEPVDTEDLVSSQEVADKLSQAIRFRTVSNADPSLVDWNEFEKFQNFLDEAYPNIFRVMEKEKVAEHNLIYRWKGSDPNALPIAFLSHQDVVPVGDEKDWTYPPFDGYDDGENINGRGSVDMKQQLIMVMEACERLIKEGFTPEQDVYLCFGCNEEVGNLPDMTGADAIAATLKERGVRLSCVIDEGGAIAMGKLYGVTGNMAAIGMAEKGFADFKLVCESAGGHSSRAPKKTALGQVCEAASKVEHNPEQLTLIPLIEDMLKSMVPYMKSFPLRFLVANLPLTKPLLLRVLDSVPAMRNFVITTTALTMAEGSPQDNILAQKPWVLVNSRILPGQDASEVKAHLEQKIGNPDVKVEIAKYHQEQSVSRYDTKCYKLLGEVINRYYPDTISVPYLMVGGSDARNYYSICDCVYRFMPIRLEKPDTAYGAHRANEFVPKNVLGRGVVILMDFIRDYSTK